MLKKTLLGKTSFVYSMDNNCNFDGNSFEMLSIVSKNILRVFIK